MRYLLVVLLLACASVGAQNVNELPLFGETQKSPDAVAADQRFVDSAVKAVGSKETAARMATFRGWQHLKQGDTEVAIQSFNQAYLLQPDNVEVYWGLGVATTQQGKFDIAVRLFQRAIAIEPDNARLLSDIGLAHTRAAVGSTQDPFEQSRRLQGALPWFDAAEKLDPNYALIYANRAITLHLLGRYAEAWANIDKAQALNRASVDTVLIAELTNKIPEGIPDEPAPQPVVQATAEPPLEATTKQEPIITAKQEPTIEAQMEAVPAPTPQSDVRPIGTAPAADVSTPATAPQPLAQPAREPQIEEAPAPKKKLRVVSGQPAHPIGPDKRACLNLPTNEAIMRCVYPRK